MNASRFQGAKAATIYVELGPEYRSTAILQVRACTRPDLTLTPGQINFGVVAVGRQPAGAIGVEYRGQQPNWQITDVDTANAANVKVDIQRLGSAPGIITYQLTASLKPDAVPGMIQDRIILRTNDASSPALTILVSGMVQAPLTIIQGKLVRLDPVLVGHSTDRSIIARGNKPFKIVKVDGEGDGLTVLYDEFPAPIQRLKISFKPTRPGVLQRKLTICTDQKDSATVTIEGTAEAATP